MTEQRKVGLFDLDGSLVDRAGTYARWAAEFFGKPCVPLGWLLETAPAYSSRRIVFFDLLQKTLGRARLTRGVARPAPGAACRS